MGAPSWHYVDDVGTVVRGALTTHADVNQVFTHADWPTAADKNLVAAETRVHRGVLHDLSDAKDDIIRLRLREGRLDRLRAKVDALQSRRAPKGGLNDAGTGGRSAGRLRPPGLQQLEPHGTWAFGCRPSVHYVPRDGCQAAYGKGVFTICFKGKPDSEEPPREHVFTQLGDTNAFRLIERSPAWTVVLITKK